MKTPEDIPEALRQAIAEESRPRFKQQLLTWGILVGVTLLALGFWFSRRQRPQEPLGTAPTPEAISQGSQTAAQSPEGLLGHFPYTEAPQGELEPVDTEGNIQLRRAAAEQFQAMVAAAQAAGIDLVPISGFRSMADQKHLFFDIKAERVQATTERAEVSAPPGYSEHHTGYAIDIGDAARPETNLSSSFEDTLAFEWLQANAPRFSFELSFPKDNPQGISYEPWHWRFVGDQHSLETFYKAKNLNPSSNREVSPN